MATMKAASFSRCLLTLLILFSHLSAQILLPIQLEPDSSVSFVIGGSVSCWYTTNQVGEGDQLSTFMQQDFGENNIRQNSITFTIHQLTEFRFGLQMDEEADGVVEVNATYNHAISKLRKIHVVLILLMETFNEISTAIHASGYATSDKVIFFVRVGTSSTNNLSIKIFHQELSSKEEEMVPFSAPIVLYENAENGTAGMYCYFCSGENLKVFSGEIEKIHFSIIADARQRTGHGMRIPIIRNPILRSQTCIEFSVWPEYNDGRPKVCTEELSIITEVSRYVNITLVSFRLPPKESVKAKRLLNVFHGEGVGVAMRNVIILTRGGLVHFGNIPRNMIACLDPKVLQFYDFTLPFAFTRELWFAILILSAILTFIYKNVALGMDIIWLFVGWGLEHSHPRKVVGFILISISIVTYTYSAYISADLMQLAEFPKLNLLFKQIGVKLLVATKGGRRNILNFFGFMPMVTKKRIMKYLGDFTPEELTVQAESWNYGSTFEILEMLAKDKRYLWGAEHLNLARKIGTGLKSIRDKYLCQVRPTNIETGCEFMVRIILRYWGYLATTFGAVHERLLEAGVLNMVNKFKEYRSQNDVRDLQMKDANGFVTPAPLNLKSAIGISALYFIAALSAIILFWGISFVCNSRRNPARKAPSKSDAFHFQSVRRTKHLKKVQSTAKSHPDPTHDSLWYINFQRRQCISAKWTIST